MRSREAGALGLSMLLALATTLGCGSSTSPTSPMGTGGGSGGSPPPTGSGGNGVGTARDAAVDLSPVGPNAGSGGGPGLPTGPPAGDAAAVATPLDAGRGGPGGGGSAGPRGGVDAAAVDMGMGVMTGAGGSPAAAYTCTLMIGILATEEWYDFGFEKMVDSSKWELIWVHSGFVELWANPTDPVWSTAITSPCAQNSGKPDRVIFLALNFDFTTAAQWNPVVTMAVDNVKAKYPSAKRIELMSFIRAPGDRACPQAPAPRSTITPAQDAAMALAAAANPGLVFVAPKFEAKTCGEFSSNPPHPSPAGVTAWATMMADYYK